MAIATRFLLGASNGLLGAIKVLIGVFVDNSNSILANICAQTSLTPGICMWNIARSIPNFRNVWLQSSCMIAKVLRKFYWPCSGWPIGERSTVLITFKYAWEMCLMKYLSIFFLCFVLLQVPWNKGIGKEIVTVNSCVKRRRGGDAEARTLTDVWWHA